VRERVEQGGEPWATFLRETGRLVVELHRAMDQLKIEGTIVEDRRRGHPELDVDPSEALVDVGRPHLVAVDGVAGEDAGAEEAPDMLPVGRRGRGGGVALAGPRVLVAAPDALLPEDLPILHRETEDDEVVSVHHFDNRHVCKIGCPLPHALQCQRRRHRGHSASNRDTV
jgi:hypothetical protein